MEDISLDDYQGKNQEAQPPPNVEPPKTHLILPSIWDTISFAGLNFDPKQMAPISLQSLPQINSNSDENQIQQSYPHYNRPPLHQKKRVLFTENQRGILLNWLIKHSNNPYPTQTEKETLMRLTGLNREQINVWFTNNRIRHGLCGAQSRFYIYNNPNTS